MMRLNIPQNINALLDVRDHYPNQTKPVYYRRDPYGLRGPFKSLKTVRVLTVGGSTTAQTNISEGQTWQDVIAENFNKAGRHIEIANAGVDGHTVLANARSFKLWFPLIPEFRPRDVLAYIGINDYCTEDDFYHDYLLVEPTWKALFKKRSAVYYLYRTIRGMFLAVRLRSVRGEDPLRSGIAASTLQKNHSDWMEPALKNYEKRLRFLLKRIRDFSSNPILVTQKMRSSWFDSGALVGFKQFYLCHGKEVNGIDVYYLLDLINQTTLKVCREDKLTCFDLASEVEFTKEDFIDEMHNSPSGSKKIGDYLANKLLQMEELDSGGN